MCPAGSAHGPFLAKRFPRLWRERGEKFRIELQNDQLGAAAGVRFLPAQWLIEDMPDCFWDRVQE